MRQRLTSKLLLLLILPPLLCTFAIGVESSRRRSTELLNEADRELTDHVTVLRTTLPRLAAQMGRASLAALIEHLAQYERVHGIALYDRDCQAIARSEDLKMNPAEIDSLVCDGRKARSEQHRVVRIGAHKVLVRAEPISSTADVGALAVTYDLSAVQEMIDAGVKRMLINSAVLALCMAGVALVIARSLGGALATLVQAAERVAAGDLGVRVNPPNRLELGRLGVAFNKMTEGLQAARQNLEVAESRRRELERRLTHAHSLRAVGQVAASLAHEIATPLSTILGWSRLAAGNPSLPAEFREQTNVISMQCERITRIVGRLLSVSRFPEGERVPVQLTEVGQEAMVFLRPECNARSIQLRAELAPDTPTVRAERDRCLQIIINLCLNAIQAQPNGGQLTLLIAPASRKYGETEQHGVEIEVRDAGPGVPRERRNSIFEPFFSTRGGGTGLGLAIVRDIVRELNGRIEVTDAKEGGACFRVFLPTDSPA